MYIFIYSHTNISILTHGHYIYNIYIFTYIHIYLHMYTYIMFLIYSSIDEYLGCFQTLTIMTIRVNIGVQIYLWDIVCFESLFPLNTYSEMELLGHILVLILTSWRTFLSFSLVAEPTYIPIFGVQGFPFLHIRSAFVITCLYDN